MKVSFGFFLLVLSTTACGADRFREVHGGVIDLQATEEVPGVSRRPYYRVFRDKSQGQCYLLPRPEEQKRELLSCEDATTLSNTLNEKLRFKAKLIEAISSFEHAVVAPYPYEDDILLCCPPSSNALRSLCEYTEGRSKMKERPMIERLMTLTEAEALAECLNKEYSVK